MAGPLPPGPLPPPWPPRPFPPPRPHIFAPLEVNYVQVNTHINDQVGGDVGGSGILQSQPAAAGRHVSFPGAQRRANRQVHAWTSAANRSKPSCCRPTRRASIYEDIVRKMKDPALMEYADRDVFKVRIFPIEPHSNKRITLSYTQVLKADSGLINYIYPLNTEKFSAKPIKNVSVKVEVETERPLKTIYSPSHSVEIKRDGSNRATVGYEASDVTPDTDFALYFAPEKNDTRHESAHLQDQR